MDVQEIIDFFGRVFLASVPRSNRHLQSALQKYLSERHLTSLFGLVRRFDKFEHMLCARNFIQTTL